MSSENIKMGTVTSEEFGQDGRKMRRVTCRLRGGQDMTVEFPVPQTVTQSQALREAIEDMMYNIQLQQANGKG